MYIEIGGDIMDKYDNKTLSENTENKSADGKSELSYKPEFDNLDTFAEGEQMDRAYLKELYGEDMDFLNKEVRMTRSQYISSYNSISKAYSVRKRETVKSLIPIAVLYAVAIAVAVFLRAVSNEFYSLVDLWEYGDSRTAAAYISGIFMAFSWLIFLSTSAILIISVITALKTLFRFKRYKKYSIQQLENRKVECMSAGQYDVGR